MGYDGSGNYTRQRNFSADASAGIRILASAMDQEVDDVASAFNQVLLRDGRAAATGNIPMGGNRLVNVGAGTNVNEYMRTREFIENVPIYMVDTNTATDTVSVSASFFTSVSATQAPRDGTKVMVRMASHKTSAPVMRFSGHSANVHFAGGGAVDGFVSGAVYELTYASAEGVWETYPERGAPRTAAEITAGVVPTNFHYAPGVVNRYGTNTTPGTTDMSAAINAALSCNQEVFFLDEDYAANNLTGSQDFQTITAIGTSRIIKNGNGALFTHSGDDLEINGVQFRGDASTPVFTGHNIVLSGENPRLINVGSRWAYGRALKSTGNAIQIRGTSDIYQSSLIDSASEYDIEIGVSGTATLYHVVHGIRSTQSTGGIHFIDTGSNSVSDCQFGKLFVDSGTAPGGVNGGKYTGNRILGDVTVELSSAIFVANQFAAVTITFAAATSGHVLDYTNTFSGTTITNNGNVNASIIEQISAGSYQEYRFGGSTAVASMRIDPSSGKFRFYSLELDNERALYLRNAADNGDAGSISTTASDNVIYAVAAGKTISISVGATASLQTDDSATATHTRLLVYDVDNATLERVTVGAADSGGAGFKVLRIPN